MKTYVRIATYGLVVAGVLLCAACGGGGAGGGTAGGGGDRPTALELAVTLRAAGDSASSCAGALTQQYALAERDCISTLGEAGYSTVEVAEALLGYFRLTPVEAARRLSEYLQLADARCLEALHGAGVGLESLYAAAIAGLQMADPREIEGVLEGLGHTEHEVLKLTAFPAVQRFAPVVGFDSEFMGLPMSAQTYFANMMVPSASDAGRTITWVPRGDYDDGPPENAALGIRILCGRDDCDRGMSNEDLGAVLGGRVPTYYDVVREAGSGRLRITYWWFYGFQFPCNMVSPEILPDDLKTDGAHHGDWEPLTITIGPTRDSIQAVTFGQHGGWYTLKPGSFERSGERPRAYVAKLAHGLYHDRCKFPECTGITGVQCGYYADFRNPTEEQWWDTSGNLVALFPRGASEPWVAAEQYGSPYVYGGRQYTITNWFWGTLMSYCRGFLLGVCLEWSHDPIYGHPTMEQRKSFEMAHCSGEDGCSRSQGW